jgi:hypothetical protein
MCEYPSGLFQGTNIDIFDLPAPLVSDSVSQKHRSIDARRVMLSRRRFVQKEQWYNLCFFRSAQMNAPEPSQTSPGNADKIVFQCPHCRTTLRVDRSAAGTTLNCDSCQKLIRVPRSRALKKISSNAAAFDHESPEELERRLKENESQRTEITGYINQANIQVHRWELQLQALNERKEQLEAELTSRRK